MRSIPDAATEMQAIPQWVCWYLKHDGERDTKPPINPHISPDRPLEERLADVNTPATWGSYEQAQAMRPHYAGIGFVFSERDPFCGIDLDKCRDPHSGQIDKWAMSIIALLGSYTEISPSGRGLHVIIRGSLLSTIEQLGRSKPRHKRGPIELYDTKRYLTWSANHLTGTPASIAPRQEELTDLYRSVFPEAEAPRHTHETPPSPQASPALLSLPDEWIIERASKMRGNGPKFARLWAGNGSDYRREDGSIDHSRADQALLGMLAYWTGRDSARMASLFQRSGLYRPNRWKQSSRGGETYGQTSIRLAIENCRSVYDPAWAATKQHPQQQPLSETGVSDNEQQQEGRE